MGWAVTTVAALMTAMGFRRRCWRWRAGQPKEYLMMSMTGNSSEPRPVHITSTFDAGNAVLESISNDVINLRITPDPYCVVDGSNHFQWFYFRASNVKGRQLTFQIINAGEASFPEAWKGYKVCHSYDLINWPRVQTTTYDEEQGVLRWSLTPEREAVWFAYFAPYSYEQHQDLVGAAVQRGARLTVLGSTLDGRPLDLLTLGDGARRVWVVARQHPGEAMAEWLAEGLLERLQDGSAFSQELLAKATFFIVPNINPDGAIRGHLRTNAAGANLNREWASMGEYRAPTRDRSPEVFHVLGALDAVGCDLFIDVHGDEALPANFFVDSAGIPGWTPRLQRLHDAFSAAMLRASRDFQTTLGYPKDAPNAANLALASKQVAQRFDCLSITLEQPFKDASNAPEPQYGWSPARAKAFGASLLDAVRDVLGTLRD
eukprot:EG_transcript_10214